MENKSYSMKNSLKVKLCIDKYTADTLLMDWEGGIVFNNMKD